MVGTPPLRVDELQTLGGGEGLLETPVGRGAAESAEEGAFAHVDVESGRQVPVYRDLPGPPASPADHPETGSVGLEVHVPDLQVEGLGYPEARLPLDLEQHPGRHVIDDGQESLDLFGAEVVRKLPTCRPGP